MKRTLAVTAMCMLAVGSAALADPAHDHAAPAAKPPAAKQDMEESMARMQGMMAGCGKR